MVDDVNGLTSTKSWSRPAKYIDFGMIISRAGGTQSS